MRRRENGWPAEMMQKVKGMWKAGTSPTEIGKLVGRSRSAVLNMMHRQGLQRSVIAKGMRAPVPPAPPPLVPRRPPPPVRQVAEERVLKGSTPRPWETRVFGECAFPLIVEGVTCSCCLPVTPEKSYCETHHSVMHVSAPSFGSRRRRVE